MPLQVAARLTPTVRQFRRRFLSAVACGLLLTTVADRCLAAAAEEYSSLPKLHLEIQHVVHFIGLVDVKMHLHYHAIPASDVLTLGFFEILGQGNTDKFNRTCASDRTAGAPAPVMKERDAK